MRFPVLWSLRFPNVTSLKGACKICTFFHSSTHTNPGQNAFRRFHPPPAAEYYLNLWRFLSPPARPYPYRGVHASVHGLDNDDIKGVLGVSFSFEAVILGLNNASIEYSNRWSFSLSLQYMLATAPSGLFNFFFGRPRSAARYDFPLCYSTCRRRRNAQRETLPKYLAAMHHENDSFSEKKKKQ